jgi:sugar/nucleoside kinase (ribokinase family)
MLVDAHPPPRITSAAVRTLCLGDALIDLVCERPVADLSQAEAFVPRFGGTVANVALVAARYGARVALAGGAGDDAWGHWLRRRLSQEGVEVSRFALVPGAQTPLALVAIDGAGEPAYEIYGEAPDTLGRALGDAVEELVRGSAALFISSNTLVGSGERELTMRAREAALASERPIVFDPNLRLHRWRTRADAAASANACVPGALLVRANATEAAVMTGEDDPERAAAALVKAGARMVVVSLGAEGAILRGELRADVEGEPVEVLSTMGAGDVLTGVLLARLALSDFYPPVVAVALPEAVRAAAQACARWGALD